MPMLQQAREHPIRTLKTCALYTAFLANGLCCGIIGPTLLDLKIAANSTLETMTWIVPSRSGGYAIGSLTIGILYRFFDTQLLAALALGGVTCMSLLAPRLRSATFIITTIGINGLFCGMLDSVCNMSMLHLWGKENPPFMQALHFFFGFGAFIAPLVAKPFLLLREDMDIEHDANNNTIYEAYPDDLRIHHAYDIVAIISLIAGCFLAYLFIFHRVTDPHPSRQVVQRTSSQFIVNPTVKAAVVVLATSFTFVYCGIEVGLGNYLTTFVVNSKLHLSKSVGAEMSSVYWATFSFFRVVCILYIDYIGSEKNIIIQLFVVMCANVILVPFGNHNEACLWAGIAIIGTGLSSIWASIYGYIEDYFPVTSPMAAAFTTSACIGEFICPVLIGLYVVNYPMIFMWVILLFSSLCVLNFVIMNVLCRFYLVQRVKKALPAISTIHASLARSNSDKGNFINNT